MIGGIDTRRVQQLQIWRIERELADASETVHCLRFMLKTSLLSCTACNSVLFGVQMTCLCSNMQPSGKAQIFFGTKCRKLLFPGVIKLQPMFYNKVSYCVECILNPRIYIFKPKSAWNCMLCIRLQAELLES
jgi:hypothetical protein